MADFVAMGVDDLNTGVHVEAVRKGQAALTKSSPSLSISSNIAISLWNQQPLEAGKCISIRSHQAVDVIDMRMREATVSILSRAILASRKASGSKPIVVPGICGIPVSIRTAMAR